MPMSDDAPRTDTPTFRDGAVRFDVDLRVYRLTAVQKVAYRMARRCTAMLGELRGDQLGVTLTFPTTVSEREALDVARTFYQELLDQELREKVRGETESVRALLLAFAFSRTGLTPRP